MEYEKVSFVEAVRSLAERLGIPLPQSSSEDDTRASEQEQLYHVCGNAGRYFYNCLTETGEGKLALDYFHQRGFSDETIRKFGLGYSPNSWSALVDYAREKNIPIELLEKAGLARKRDDGSYHDYFRGRAMFPIFSTTGRVLGFGARKLREDDQLGKYLNSPETLIYTKSKILYGLFHAKDDIREKNFVILVEGYTDLISVFQAGIRNIVASSGTALTEDQIRLISRYTDNITIVYDADSAGSKAALRGVDLILENDLNVRVVTLPEGDDPDSFVRKQGGEAFRTLVNDAISFVDFIAGEYERQGKLETVEGQAQTIRAIVQTIAKMKDELKRNFYIKQVAEKYHLYESVLFRELEKILGTNTYQKDALTLIQADGVQQSDNSARPPMTEMPPAEKELLQAMLTEGDEGAKIAYKFLQIEDLINQHSRSIVNAIFTMLDEHETMNIPMLLDLLPEEKQILTEMLVPKNQLSERWPEFGTTVKMADPRAIVIDAIIKIKSNAKERYLSATFSKMKEARDLGEDTIPYLMYQDQLRNKLDAEINMSKEQLKGYAK